MEAAAVSDIGLMSLYVRERDTLLFWMDAASREPRVERAAVSATEIADASAMLQTQLAPANINYRRPERTADLTAFSKLGQRLLAPVADALAGVRRVVVAPHGELHAWPVHALAAADADPLGLTHAVTYVPNLSLYASLLDRGLTEHQFELLSLCLATAAADDGDVIRESFLIGPRSFAEATGGVFRDELRASKTAFRKHAASAALIYLSCHGQFDPKDSLDSCLLLSDGETLPSLSDMRQSRHRLSVRQILELRIRTPLVVLDACMSGMQGVSPGDEPTGFPTAFLLAGASAVIAANWVVEQNCARDFMLGLLDEWARPQVTLGDAVQRAYTRTRAQRPHPFHWAAFSLFGNDRLLFPGRHTDGHTVRTDRAPHAASGVGGAQEPEDRPAARLGPSGQRR